MNKKAVYSFLIISLAVCSGLIIFLCYYIIGIIELSSVSNVIEKRFVTIAAAIQKNEQETENYVLQFSEDNIAKAKSFSFMLNHSTEELLDAESLEEIRVALKADELIVTDENARVIAGTSAYIGQNFSNNDVYRQFLPILEDRSAAFTVNSEKDGVIYQYAGAARSDSTGIVVVKLSAKRLEQAVRLSDISTVTADFPILKKGKTAIIDISSWTFVSHTDEKYISAPVQIDVSRFSELDSEKIYDFKIKFDNIKYYVFYKEYNGRIISAFVPVSEVFSHRNYMVTGLLIGAVILTITAVLSVRSKLIWIEEAKAGEKNESSD